MSRSMAITFLAPILLTACVSAVVGEADMSSRRLLGVKKNFPYSTCAKAVAGSPYLLSGPPPEVRDGVLYLNLTFIANPQAASSNACYGELVNNVKMVQFRSGVKCTGEGATKVYVNGALKAGGNKWHPQPGQADALLSLNNLKLTSGVIGNTIDVLVSGACNSPGAFTGPRGGKLVYTITPGTKKQCCPVAAWNWGATWSAEKPTAETSEEGSAEASQIPAGEESSAEVSQIPAGEESSTSAEFSS